MRDLEPTTPIGARLRLALLAPLALLVASGLVPAAEAAVPKQFFGVSALRPDAADFQRMGEGGLGSYRVGIGWRGVQPTRASEYRWGGPDQLFLHAARAGLQPVPYLIGTPTFVSKRDDRIKPPTGSERNRREWREFVAAAVRRYGPGGDFWREHPLLPPRPARDWLIWNEQNARDFWRPKASPGAYAALLRLSRRAIASVDPDARLVTGGMFGYPKHRNSISARAFLRRLYRHRGVARAIDGVALHPYARGVRGVKKQIRQARRAVRRGGDRGVELWIGEIGWASDGDRGHFLVKSRAKQAKILRRALGALVAKREAWRIRGVFWIFWRDYEEDPLCPWCPHAGLIERDGEAKPSWDAYRRLIARSR